VVRILNGCCGAGGAAAGYVQAGHEVWGVDNRAELEQDYGKSGAAGFLQGLTATTHPSAFEELKPYCATVVDRRIVDEGNVVTGRGVTSSIDLGLHLVERLAGHDVRERIIQLAFEEPACRRASWR